MLMFSKNGTRSCTGIWLPFPKKADDPVIQISSLKYHQRLRDTGANQPKGEEPPFFVAEDPSQVSDPCMVHGA